MNAERMIKMLAAWQEAYTDQDALDERVRQATLGRAEKRKECQSFVLAIEADVERMHHALEFDCVPGLMTVQQWIAHHVCLNTLSGLMSDLAQLRAATAEGFDFRATSKRACND